MLEPTFPTAQPPDAGTTGRTSWVLLVRIDEVSLGPEWASSKFRVCVKYGDREDFEKLATAKVRSTDAKDDQQSKADFGSTCVFAWRRHFTPIIRLSLRKSGLVEWTVAKAAVRIPLCEERPSSGCLVRPGSFQQELELVRKGGGDPVGRVGITAELRGVPRDDTCSGHDNIDISPGLLQSQQEVPSPVNPPAERPARCAGPRGRGDRQQLRKRPSVSSDSLGSDTKGYARPCSWAWAVPA
mmetsp:Transcript_3679/g.10106  ORF Transcript_3679/g.10106 Transcript_3679/m.10106 type:complete len:241 (-) Transcript_3679:57-779(-)